MQAAAAAAAMAAQAPVVMVAPVVLDKNLIRLTAQAQAAEVAAVDIMLPTEERAVLLQTMVAVEAEVVSA